MKIIGIGQGGLYRRRGGGGLSSSTSERDSFKCNTSCRSYRLLNAFLSSYVICFCINSVRFKGVKHKCTHNGQKWPDHTDNYLDTSRNILSQEMLLNMQYESLNTYDQCQFFF